MDYRNDILDFSLEELQEIVLKLGYKKFRAKQIYDWLHKNGVFSYLEMTNIPKTLINQLSNNYPLYQPTIQNLQVSIDGTRKYVLKLEDKLLVECVLIPADDNRLTACISTQVGCPVGCEFCATGKQGFLRNLQSYEIVNQVSIIQKDTSKRISNIVVMGQGEPFLNFENTVKAIKRLNSDELFKIASRKITVSTSGIIEGIEKFSNMPEQFGLAVSLHSAEQEVRNVIMPKMKNQPLESLSMALKRYVEKTNRRVTLEYMLLDGLTDTEHSLNSLITFSSQFLSHVNLINFNEIDEVEYKKTKKDRMIYFEEKLKKAGIPASIRISKGSDISGACGQLANKL